MIIRSMTGFGRNEIVTEDLRLSVEMKAVNHRYLDLSIKMPRRFNRFESSIRALLKEEGVERGKIDFFVNYEDYKEQVGTLRYNASLAKEYVDVFRAMSEQFGLENDMRVSTLARLPEVLTLETREEDEEELWKLLQECIRGAVEAFKKTREEEGARLKADLLLKLDVLDDLVNQVEARQPGIMEEYRARLDAKVRDYLENVNIDDSRIATEIAVFSDKVCTDEETVRLHSHIQAVRDTLNGGGSIGRKLDFLAQEMNREANTILSKANDLISSDIGIGLKTEIEKIREQIQNLE